MEFTDFFTKTGGIDKHYNKHFPKDWTQGDWEGFDNTIAASIQTWIKNGCQIEKPSITASGWKKKFTQTFGFTMSDIIIRYIDIWISKGQVKNSDLKVDLMEYYSENNIQQKYQVSGHRLNLALAEYCKHYDIKYQKEIVWSELGILYRGKQFGNVD